jgi:putative hemolysin
VALWVPGSKTGAWETSDMVVANLSSNSFEPVQAGNLIARLARSPAEIDAAQALRYRVFFEEMDAVPFEENIVRKRDFDRFDEFCDHLLVINRDRTDVQEGVVGTYRLLRRSVARHHGGFYSADEYDIAPILTLDGEIMELGRSCVDPESRTRHTMQLLWQAIAAYVNKFEIQMMFGCASLPGSDPSAQRLALAYLHHFHAAPKSFRPRALTERYVDMNCLPKNQIDTRKALAALPPLIKGYLRLGGFIGDGAVIDPQFNTTDVCVMVKTDLITKKYFKHYERSAHWSAAG